MLGVMGQLEDEGNPYTSRLPCRIPPLSSGAWGSFSLFALAPSLCVCGVDLGGGGDCQCVSRLLVMHKISIAAYISASLHLQHRNQFNLLR